MSLETITQPPINPENNLGMPSVEKIFDNKNPFTPEELEHSLLSGFKKYAVLVAIGIAVYELLKRAFKQPDKKKGKN